MRGQLCTRSQDTCPGESDAGRGGKQPSGKQPHTRAGRVNSFCFEMNTCSRSPGNRACSLQSIPVTEHLTLWHCTSSIWSLLSSPERVHAPLIAPWRINSIHARPPGALGARTASPSLPHGRELTGMHHSRSKAHERRQEQCCRTDTPRRPQRPRPPERRRPRSYRDPTGLTRRTRVAPDYS